MSAQSPQSSNGSAEAQDAPLPDPAEQQISDDTAKAYIVRKLDPQRDWLNTSAMRSKIYHHLLLGVSIVTTSSIVFANSLHMPLLSSALAVIAAIATSVSGSIRAQENWIRYRNATSALDSIKLKYEIMMPPYDGPGRNGLLIEEAEKIFAQEQAQWAKNSGPNTRKLPPSS